MQVRFEKWHGCRNDFIVLWLFGPDSDLVLASLRRQAAALCDRHAGIGADGLLVLTTHRKEDLEPYRLTIINSDGSIAKNCGNGLRCAASSVLKAHRERGTATALDALDSIDLTVEGVSMVCRFMKKNVDYPFVAVDMGVPRLGASVSWRAAALSAVNQLGQSLDRPALGDEVEVCDLGNPHVVITTDEASRDLVLAVGPRLQATEAWSTGLDGINVHLAKAVPVTASDQARARQDLGAGSGTLGELHQVYVWERGAGETMACGSGACAVAATAFVNDLVDRQTWIGVDMPGGRLYVRHEGPDEPAVLAGPATFVYQGTVEI